MSRRATVDLVRNIGALCRQFDDWAPTTVNLAVLGIFAGTANIEKWAVYFAAAVVAVMGLAVAPALRVRQHHRTVVLLVVVVVPVVAAVVVGANLDRNLSFDCELTDMVIDLWKYFAVEVSYTAATVLAVGYKVLAVVPNRPVARHMADVVAAVAHGRGVMGAVVRQAAVEHFVDAVAVVVLPQQLHWQLAGTHSYSHSDVGAVAADLTIAVMNLMLVLDPEAVVRVCSAVVVVDSAILQLPGAVVVAAAGAAAVCFLEEVDHSDRDLC